MPPAVTWQEIEARKAAYDQAKREREIRHDERRRLLAWLTRNTSSISRIGERCLLVHCAINPDEDGHRKCLLLGAHLGKSKPAIYKAISRVVREMEGGKMSTFLQSEGGSGKM